MYKIGRECISAAPMNQQDLDTNLDWFLIESTRDHDNSLDDDENEETYESIVKGDRIHSDGLRVVLFATEKSLSLLGRARTILGDGTFKICPSQWYQVFILSAEIKDKVFFACCGSMFDDSSFSNSCSFISKKFQQ